MSLRLKIQRWIDRGRDEQGIALLIALIALSIFSVLGMYMSLNATTEVRISDNYESRVQASLAAKAGLAHAREILRGLQYNDLLKGPDGSSSNDPTYLTQARSVAFRNPMDWAVARTVQILNPAADLGALPDDGLINTGAYTSHGTTTSGTVLIPKLGTAFTANNPYGAGTITTARYFVRVSDNNGEASEDSDPFNDNDHIIIVRSMGVAPTITETGGYTRRNSVAVFESRFKESQTFNLSSPLTIEGNNVNATFNGMPWQIRGSNTPGVPGLGTIDTNTSDTVHPADILKSAVGGTGTISGGGLASPSIADVTAATASDPDKAKLMDANYLWHLVYDVISNVADYVYEGSQSWNGGSAPYLGSYDHTKPANAPGQDPKITYVHGNLNLSGNMTGGGLLVVTGDLNTNGRLTWDGLILVIGNGYMDAGGLNQGVYGGVFVANIIDSGGTKSFGTPSFRMSGNSNIFFDASALAMSVGLLPPEQLSYREITSAIDP